MIYFTADLHFGHENIIKFCKRPFDSIEAMDKAMIANYNAAVQDDDEVYIIGDFTRSKQAAKAYLSVLNGKKYLVAGNHDNFIDDFNADGWFEWVKEYAVINYKGVKFILCHYPIAEWAGFYKGTVHLHGHIHNRPVESWNPAKIRAFNVGVDVCGYKPVSMDEIIKRANKIPVINRDNKDD